MQTAFGTIPAVLIFMGVALIPGWAMSFVVFSLIFDQRPLYDEVDHLSNLPPITVIVAAYNEKDSIAETIEGIVRQDYSSLVEIIVADDGSTDATRSIVEKLISDNKSEQFTIRVVGDGVNMGKASALNNALTYASNAVIVTVDADSYLYENALKNIVSHLVNSDDEVGAVAGTILVRNSRANILTKMQEWDYFHGISVIKRVQSMYQGTLVAQGAFSVYKREALELVNGWDDTVGEDIVLTWGLRAKGYKIGFSEVALCFTNVPDTLGQFINQRKRWARGLIEAFRKHPNVIWDVKKNSPFVWYNLAFPFLDMVYIFVFIPGIIAALFFKIYIIAGFLTLLLLPLSMIGNIIFFVHQRSIFKRMGLKVRRNWSGVILYSIVYQFIMAYASVLGYTSEFFNLKKVWGTK
jgi:biofilm PGA synthesis N-glycosyltransferase PgaC